MHRLQGNPKKGAGQQRKYLPGSSRQANVTYERRNEMTQPTELDELGITGPQREKQFLETTLPSGAQHAGRKERATTITKGIIPKIV